MRNMSFSLTTPQMRAKTKHVTRRLGWIHLRAGDQVMACEKCMGRKAGEPLVRIGPIMIHTTRWESLSLMTPEECIREGFPDLTPSQFIEMFCATHKGCTPSTVVHRIAFRHLYV